MQNPLQLAVNLLTATAYEREWHEQPSGLGRNQACGPWWQMHAPALRLRSIVEHPISRRNVGDGIDRPNPESEGQGGRETATTRLKPTRQEFLLYWIFTSDCSFLDAVSAAGLAPLVGTTPSLSEKPACCDEAGFMVAARLLWSRIVMSRALSLLLKPSDRPSRADHRWGRLCSISTPLLLTSCQSSVLDPKGPVGSAEKMILLDCVGIMLAIVIPTILATLGVAWWFRASNSRAHRRPDWAFSGRIELITWSIPFMTIMLLGGVTWIGSHDLDPSQPLASQTSPLEVEVISLDWKWLFIYPKQNVASVNMLVLPVGTPVHFELTSASVLNTFFVPQLGSMIYVMNGMADQLNLEADEAGDFYGESGHFSGDGFSDMNFTVHAVPDSAFMAWIQAHQRGGQALDVARYNVLARQSINDTPMTFSSADPNLFDKVVNQVIPPGPGPHTTHPDPEPKPTMEH